MKKFAPTTGGHSFRLDDLALMQNAYSEALKGLVYSIDPSGNVILSGLSISSGQFSLFTNFTEGYVAYKGEIFYCPPTQVSNLFSIPLNGDPNYGRFFLRVIQTVITPSSPVVYEDTATHNVHYERTMVIKGYDPADGDDYTLNGMFYDSVSYYSRIQTGFVFEWYPSYVGEENAVFDSSGLGIKRMRGYAICNGLNNTPDLRGQYTFMPSVNMKNSASLIANVVDNASLSQRFGRKTQSILQNNLPSYNLLVTDPGHQHSMPRSGTTGGGGSDAFDVDSTTYRPGDPKTQVSPTNITVNLNGGNQPLLMLPPSFSMIKILRIF